MTTSRLIRMDRTGHTTLAEWVPGDVAGQAAAQLALHDELERGFYAILTRPDGSAEQVRELPAGEALVVLRRPIAGG